jgi:hypothetical protein
MHTNGNINKRLAVFGLSAFLIYAIICLVPTTSPAPQVPPSAPVTVVNTTTNPVPVVQQGALTINGTPNVNVANSAASPVLVRSVDSGAVQPVQLIVEFFIVGTLFARTNFYTVPDGKRLVIEYFSSFIEPPTGQHVLRAFVFTQNAAGGTTGELYAPLQFNGSDGVGFDSFTSGGLVKAYVEAGGKVTGQIDRDTSDGVTLGTITVSGYLINVP